MLTDLLLPPDCCGSVIALIIVVTLAIVLGRRR